MEILIGLLIFLSFFVSASAGLGGSLLLIPTLTLLLGVKEGIVLSSILLGLNNVVKAIYYRRDIQWRGLISLLVPMGMGAAIGAWLMVNADAKWLGYFLLAHVGISFFIQRYSNQNIKQKTGILYAALSGFCSGLSGTSGPLKGMAVKCFYSSKTAVVAAASVLSLATDSIKSGMYLTRLPDISITFYLLAFGVAVMPMATALGRYCNRSMSTRAYDAFFYTVMGGYVVRLFV